MNRQLFLWLPSGLVSRPRTLKGEVFWDGLPQFPVDCFSFCIFLLKLCDHRVPYAYDIMSTVYGLYEIVALINSIAVGQCLFCLLGQGFFVFILINGGAKFNNIDVIGRTKNKRKGGMMFLLLF